MTDDIVTYSTVVLRPDPARTVIRPFVPEDAPAFAIPNHPRAQRIADRVLALDGAGLAQELQQVLEPLSFRYRDIADVLMRRFEAVNGPMINQTTIVRDQALLIGAYFSEEYSFESAALFNPGIVRHPDQSGLPAGAIRFILSLRGLGEGSLSSITFRTGTWRPNAEVLIDPASRWAVTPRIEISAQEDPDQMVRLLCGGSRDLSETVIFPIMPSQRGGIEDLRMVQFADEDGSIRYIGTYTAFSGSEIRQELLQTSDFSTFEMRPLGGSASATKGMALFPRRIGGRYLMLGRQDNENIWLLTSDDLHIWEGGRRIIAPKWPWEFIQLGNCGSPIEIEEGWLVISHGVGAVRNYCMGACLLDRDDPSKVLARTTRPLLRASAEQRDGYVPNVVYSCGALVHQRTLFLPYGVADSFTTFASVPLADLLATMT